MADGFTRHDIRAIEDLYSQREAETPARWVPSGRQVVLITLPLPHLAGLVVGGSALGGLIGGLVMWSLGKQRGS